LKGVLACHQQHSQQLNTSHTHTHTHTTHQQPTHTHTTSTPVIKKVGIKGVSAFAVAPSTAQQLIAAFVPEAKGQPAAACIVDASGGDAVVLSRRSFYRATGGWLGGLKGVKGQGGSRV